MNFQKIKLVKENFLNEVEKQDWEGGIFIGKEKSNFYINLPDGYEYNQDIRLQGTNSFYYKNENFAFTIIGEEVQKSLHLYQNEEDNFENSICEYMDKVFSYLKSNGIENPKNLKLYKIETEKVSWYRANYSYEMNNKIFSDTYNLLGKTLIKIFSNKTLKEAGYEKNKTYREHKIIDFLSFKINSNQKYFALIYTFDEISTKDTEDMLKIINEISKSLGYYNN